VSDGYGLVVTSGGGGAEDKDRTIEALQLLDPDLATADLVTYEPGRGRHIKPAARVGAMELGWSTVVALPGPTHEVRLALPVVAEALAAGRSIPELVVAVATVLRGPLRPTES
jgi:molybdopterin biosynthesis enzyme MoaB